MVESDVGFVIIGAGGHARVVAEALLPVRPAGHLSPVLDSPDIEALGPRLGDDRIAARLADNGHRMAMGIGFVDRAGAIRRSTILDVLEDIELSTVIHPTADVSPSASIGHGGFVAVGAIIGTAVIAGSASIVNSGAIIDHDVRIGRNVHIGPGAVVSGSTTIGDDTLIGVGAVVRQGVRIGRRVVVGAGAVVVSDVPDDVTVVGVPARSVVAT